MPAIGPVLLMAGGLLGLVIASKKKEPPPAPAGPRVMSEELRLLLASAMDAIGADANGNVGGTPSEEGIQLATQIAGRIAAAGFPDVAEELRAAIRRAAEKVPPPAPDKQIPLPGIPADLRDMFNRTIQLERDPARLRAVLGALEALPNASDPEVQSAISMLRVLIAQIEANERQADAIREVDEVVTSPGLPTSPAPKPPDDLFQARPVPTRPAPAGANNVSDPARVSAIQALLDAGSCKQASELLQSSPERGAGGAGGPGVVGFDDRIRLSAAVVTCFATVPPGLGEARPPSPRLPPIVPEPPPTVQLPRVPVPQPPPLAKSRAEIAAEDVAAHLLGLQANAGGDLSKVKGREDVSKVKRFQTEEGLTQDGKMGPGMGLRLAKYVGSLPLVMYWPRGANMTNVAQYKQALTVLAQDAASKGNNLRAQQLTQSAQREQGQGGVAGGGTPSPVIIPTPSPIVPSPSPSPSPGPAPRPPPAAANPAAAAKAQVMADHLNDIQRKNPKTLKKGGENKALVQDFQRAVGDTADGKAGPGTLLKAADFIGQVPLVMYWPSGATTTNVVAYKKLLDNKAAAAAAAGDLTRAAALRASAAKEKGQGGVAGGPLK